MAFESEAVDAVGEGILDLFAEGGGSRSRVDADLRDADVYRGIGPVGPDVTVLLWTRCNGVPEMAITQWC